MISPAPIHHVPVMLTELKPFGVCRFGTGRWDLIFPHLEEER